MDAAPEDRGNRANHLVYSHLRPHLLLPAFDSLSPLVLPAKLFAATGLLLLSLLQKHKISPQDARISEGGVVILPAIFSILPSLSTRLA